MKLKKARPDQIKVKGSEPTWLEAITSGVRSIAEQLGLVEEADPYARMVSTPETDKLLRYREGMAAAEAVLTDEGIQFPYRGTRKDGKGGLFVPYRAWDPEKAARGAVWRDGGWQTINRDLHYELEREEMARRIAAQVDQARIYAAQLGMPAPKAKSP